MAYVYKSEGVARPVDLDYPELAALHQRMRAGDPVAAIQWERLPDGEKRLAVMLVKTFKGKTKKPKTPKPPKKPDPIAAMLADDLNSPDPAIREAAWKVRYGEN